MKDMLRTEILSTLLATTSVVAFSLLKLRKFAKVFFCVKDQSCILRYIELIHRIFFTSLF